MTADRRLPRVDDLPEGWRWARLGDLLSFVGSGITPRGGRKVYQSTGIPFIRSQNVYPDGLRLDGVAYVSPELHEAMSRTHLQPNDVLLNITGASIGRSTVVPDWLGPSNVNQHVCILRSLSAIEPFYLSKFLNSGLGQQQIMDSQSGVTRQGLNYEQIRELVIPLAPPAEQNRIVAKIEALFAQSRRGREALDAVPILLTRFRQAVLAAAFRGQLTQRNPDDEPASLLLERIRAQRRRRWEKDLRARGKDPSRRKYKEPVPLDTSDLPELPAGWVWTTLDHVLELLQYGTSVKADATPASGVPVLRMGNIQEGELLVDRLKYIHPDRENLGKYWLEKGDILINRTNSPKLVGKSALFDRDEPFVFASYLIRLRVGSGWAMPEYIVHLINSSLGRAHIAKVRHQVAGQANINSGNIRSMPLPLSPLAEQRRIVARIEALFAQADALEAAATAAHRRLSAVDQAILARAFRGQLVPQDPADEPASVLLERIREQREGKGN